MTAESRGGESGLLLPSGLPKPGTVIAGKYRLDRLVGLGGMGVVYQGFHPQLGVAVAVKVVLPDIARRPEIVARFLNEAKAAARIQSEHIARVTDVGTLDDGIPFLVMELLEGEDLESVLARLGPQSVRQSVDWMLEAIAGLAEAHLSGVIHRDLKPSNLFLARRIGRPDKIKICDFGISKATFEGEASLTQTNSLLGSPSYMAPEQLRSSKTVDARADVWSLGIILYELLTGTTPFVGENVGAVFAAIHETEPTRPRVVRPEIPEGLDDAIIRCLARRPEERFSDVGELAAALAPFGSDEGRTAIDKLAPTRKSSPVASTLADVVPAKERVSTPDSLKRPSAAMATSRRYRPIAELGRGGMATVYLTVVQGPAGFNKLQVVKRLRPALAADPEFLQMFMEEARLAARISHANVVQTNEVGFDGEHHFIAMEYLEGQSLESIVRRVEKLGNKDQFPLPMQLRVLSQILEGLHFAHELTDFGGARLNVVHRDVSPHNIIVTYDGEVKLVDFGIAKAADSSSDTRTGVLKGKCAYMAPEQFGGKSVDRRADVFAVGVMLWQALTGKRMWKGLSDAEIFQKLALGEIPKPSDVTRDVSPQLEAICMRALSIKPEMRHATALELQTELEDYIHTLPRITQREVGKRVAELFADSRAEVRTLVERQLKSSRTDVPVIGAGDVSSSGMMSVGSTQPEMRGSRRRILLLGIVGVAAITAIVFAGVKMRQPPIGPVAVSSASVTINATPKQASIFVDDRVLASNPATIAVARDGASHRVRAEAPGYTSKTQQVVADSTSISVDVALEKENATIASAGTSVAPATTSTHVPTTTTRVVPPPASTSVAPPASTTPPASSSGKVPAGLDTSDPWKH